MILCLDAISLYLIYILLRLCYAKISHMQKVQLFLQISIIILLFCLLLVLFFRSFIFATRTISEFIVYIVKHQKQTVYLPYIGSCSSQKILTTGAEKQLFNYRSLGVKCEK